MLIWSGRGILSFLVLIVFILICVSILPKEFSIYGLEFSFLITASFSWYFGQKWNNAEERIVIDEKTNQRIILKNNHSLFWIPMQYWAIITSAIGVIISVQEDWIIGSISLIGLIVFGMLLFMNRKVDDKEVNQTKAPERERPFKAATPKTPEPVSEVEEAEKKAEELRRRLEREDPSRFMPK